ncbi:hypothetical protein ATG70_1710 [Bacillus sp. es.036]|nr:hypothetical protein ATG70_1710 [Bacillus sp. es.036]
MSQIILLEFKIPAFKRAYLIKDKLRLNGRLDFKISSILKISFLSNLEPFS